MEAGSFSDRCECGKKVKLLELSCDFPLLHASHETEMREMLF